MKPSESGIYVCLGYRVNHAVQIGNGEEKIESVVVFGEKVRAAAHPFRLERTDDAIIYLPGLGKISKGHFGEHFRPKGSFLFRIRLGDYLLLQVDRKISQLLLVLHLSPPASS